MSSDEDASCFQHAEAAAEAVCGTCGRYMCGVCATTSPDGESICLPCLQELSDNEQKARWRREWVTWDTIALHLAVAPVVMPFLYYMFVFSAPAATAISIWKWNNPRKRPLPRGRVRIYFALLFSLLQLILIGGMVYFFAFVAPYEDG